MTRVSKIENQEIIEIKIKYKLFISQKYIYLNIFLNI